MGRSPNSIAELRRFLALPLRMIAVCGSNTLTSLWPYFVLSSTPALAQSWLPNGFAIRTDACASATLAPLFFQHQPCASNTRSINALSFKNVVCALHPWLPQIADFFPEIPRPQSRLLIRPDERLQAENCPIAQDASVQVGSQRDPKIQGKRRWPAYGRQDAQRLLTREPCHEVVRDVKDPGDGASP